MSTIAEPPHASTSPRPRARGDRVGRALLLALLLLLLASAVLFVHQSWQVITFPYPVDYGEGPLLDQAVRLARMENIYDPDLGAPPYTVANYPPLYPLLQALAVKSFGPAFWYGRLLSWISVVVASLLLAAILHGLTGRWLPGLVAGLLLLSVPYVSFWAALFRIDGLALASSLGALFVLVRWPAVRWSLLLAAALLTAAVFTRQSYALAAPLAAFVWLASAPSTRRRAFELAGLLALAAAGLALVIDGLTDGGFFFHTVTANVNEFHLARLTRYGRELGWMLPGLLLLGLLHAAWGRRLAGNAWRLIAPYSLGALLSAATIGKSGSNVNYLLELSAALALSAGALLAGLHARPLARHAVALVLLVQASLLVGGTRYQDHLRWKLDQRPALDRLMQVVRGTRGPVLADEDLGLLPLDGRPIHAQPFELTQLARRGAWDPAPFLDELERQEFDAVLIYRVPWSPIHRTRWSPEMLERLERGYRAETTVGQTVIYRPRGL